MMVGMELMLMVFAVPPAESAVAAAAGALF